MSSTIFELMDTAKKDEALDKELKELAWAYGATYESHYWFDYPFIINHLPPGEKEIADFGCGIGVLDFYLAEHGYKVWAYDKHDVRWFIERHPNITFVHSDLSSRDGGLRMGGRIIKQFDCVISASAIEHNTLEEMTRIVNEGFKILKPGGWLIVTSEAWTETKWAPLQECTCQSHKDIETIFRTKVDFTPFNEMYGKFKDYANSLGKPWEFLPYGIGVRK